MQRPPQQMARSATTGIAGRPSSPATSPPAGEDPAAFERAMRALLHPGRIAIVGDTPKPGFASNIHRTLVRCGYEGAIYPVNPRYREILGLPAYPSLEAIPGGADLAIVVVPSHLVMDALASCERAGVGAADVITSGFGEKQDDADDAATRVIGCFVEQFREPEKLLAAAELAAERRKPIVVLKIGRSEAGRRSALAHTGSLVGADEVVDAVMRQQGITRVYNLDEM